MPRNPGTGWSYIPATQSPTVIKRLGDGTLLATRLNSNAANAAFAEKKKHFAKSEITLTKNLCSLADWTPAEIAARQSAMAELAVKAWPGKPN